MLRVGVITKKDNIYSLNAETREEIDNFILNIDDKEGLKRYKIIDKDKNVTLESWHI